MPADPAKPDIAALLAEWEKDAAEAIDSHNVLRRDVPHKGCEITTPHERLVRLVKAVEHYRYVMARTLLDQQHRERAEAILSESEA